MKTIADEVRRDRTYVIISQVRHHSRRAWYKKGKSDTKGRKHESPTNVGLSPILVLQKHFHFINSNLFIPEYVIFPSALATLNRAKYTPLD